MAGKPSLREAGRTPEIPGVQRKVRKGVATNVDLTPDRHEVRLGRSRGQIIDYKPSVTYPHTGTSDDFSAIVSVSGENQPGLAIGRSALEGIYLGRKIQAAEAARFSEVVGRGGITLQTAQAMESVADVTIAQGREMKIYSIRQDGVVINLTPAQLATVGLGHVLRGVTIDVKALLGLPSMPQLNAPSGQKEAPDRGIKVEPARFTREGIQSYLTAMVQFNQAFGEDAVAMVSRVFAEPYGERKKQENYDRILALVEHATRIIAASANPGIHFDREQSILESQLQASVDQSNFERRLTMEAGKAIAGGIADEAKRRGHRAAGILSTANRGLEHTSVQDVPAEDDLLEVAAVGAINHAASILSSPSQDPRTQKWQAEVREVLGWAFRETDKRTGLSGQIAQTPGMRTEAIAPLQTYNRLRALVG